MLCYTATELLPPVHSWSKKVQNRCAFEDLPQFWNAFDVMVFFADVRMYNASLDNDLDDTERERVLQFTSSYFKKRYSVSRALIKRVLEYIPGAQNHDAVILSRENKRIMVTGIPDIFFSLSYSGNSIALCAGKKKTGIDIERVYITDLKKIRTSPLFDRSKCRNKEEESLHSLQIWTLIEAYAKLRDRNPFPLVNNSSLLQDACFVTYLADLRTMVSIAWDTGDLNHVMFWIDPDTFSSDPDQRKSSRLR